MDLLRTLALMLPLSFSMIAGGQDMPYTPHPDWENPEHLFEGREVSRAFFVPFAGRDEALKGGRENSSRWMSLNGQWKFHWAPKPDDRPVDFYKPEFDVSGWKDIDVPSNWQMRGYGTPIYSNQRYTFVRNWPLVMTPPRDDDEKKYTTPATEPNAVGSYRREVELPESWNGQRVFIQFDGVDSFFYLFVNGQKVGFSKDSRTAAIFDITRYVHPGKNIIAAEVYRYSDGSYLECQDMWRLSGIFRDVSMFSTPHVLVRDFFVHTDFAKRPNGSRDYADCHLRVEVEVDNRMESEQPFEVEAELLGADGKRVAVLSSVRGRVKEGHSVVKELTAQVKDPALWSAEKPNLYRLMIYLKDANGRVSETISRKIGFREVCLENGRFLVNGMPVKLKGVNRHESQHANGHTVTREECLAELLLMKRGNINHVRNSHYPQPAFFYELCDELGIYVCDEANIESHGYYYGELSLSHPQEWKAQHVWRNQNMVEQSKNHPCVVIWSYGNEAGPGANFEAVRDWIKSRDTSRVTQYERNNDLADLCSNQYPSVNWTREIASRKLEKPWYISEYAHILCNSMGNLQDYWEAIDSSDSIIGGGIWEWIHQSYDQEVTLPDGSKIVRQSYGGDHGEFPNDGIFCIKGVIYSDRTTTPIYDEIRKVQQNVGMAYLGQNEQGLRISLHNKHLFTDLSEYEGRWEITEEGSHTIASGSFTASVPPLETHEFIVPVENIPVDKFLPDRRYFITVSFHLKNKTDWAEAGYTVATEQMLLPEGVTNYAGRSRIMRMDPNLKLEVRNQNGQMLVIGQNFSVSIDKVTGGLKNYIVNGQEIIGDKATLHLNAFRAPLANDKWVMNQWLINGFRNMIHTASPLIVERLSDGVVRVSCDVVSRGIRKESLDSLSYDNACFTPEDNGPVTDRDLYFSTQLVYTIMPNGYISVQAGILPNKDDKIVLPRLGFTLSLPEQYNRVQWYGRGPGENYPDRKAGSPVGIYSRTVSDMVERYPLPMEMGNRMDVQWVAVTNENGVGLLVSPVEGESFNFSALPYTPQAIFKAKHPEEVEPAHATVLNVDALTLGLGGAACGPRPIDRDVPLAGATSFSFALQPVMAGDNPVEVGRRSLPLTGAVTISRDELGYVNARCDTKDAKIHLTLPDGSVMLYTQPFLQREEGTMRAYATMEGCLDSATTWHHLGTWRPGNLLRIVSCSSSAGRAESPWSLIDGRSDTFWHSKWQNTPATYPHEIVVDLGVESELRGFTITPRQARTSTRVRKLAFYLSMDGKSWPETPDCTLEMEDSDHEQSVIIPDVRNAKYVKIVCLEPMVPGEPYAALAEFSPIITRYVGEYPARAYFAVNYVSSELPGVGPARNVLDGNENTFWHSMRGVTVASYPHDIRLDLGNELRLKGIRYQAAPSPDSRIKDYEIYVSTDGQNWGSPVARGSFRDDRSEQQALFFTPANARYVRLVALSSHSGGDYAAISELDVIQADDEK